MFRRKRGGKAVGSYVCVWQGRQTNLRTQDARTARQRVRELAAGTWSPGAESEPPAGSEVPAELADAIVAAAGRTSGARARPTVSA